ncbi:right-handed parallel beta-helix repeat-containing protein [bacterium]|nr:right-handed parallel beta-helix repeat-containing protein [candidate division CSSED10-310 bacterium]
MQCESSYGYRVLTDCEVSSNQSSDGMNGRGGGLYCDASNIEISCCRITGNLCLNSGAGLQCINGDTSRIINCFIYGNGPGDGGGIACHAGACPEIGNCTFDQNDATTGFGGAIYADQSSSPVITNCIMWFNYIEEIFAAPGSGLTVTFSDVMGGWPGAGIIDEDPLYEGIMTLEYYLSQTAAGQAEDSPCVDAGSTAAADVCFTASDGSLVCLDQYTTRTDGVPDQGTVDMGYHQVSNVPPPVPATGYFGLALMALLLSCLISLWLPRMRSEGKV